MFYPTESKAQGWRAMARFEDGREALLLIGRSSTQVRQGYIESFTELLDEEEREQVLSISLQRWHGAPAACRAVRPCKPFPDAEQWDRATRSNWASPRTSRRSP